MPVNEEGVEVNEDGTPVTPEQRETYDWDTVLKLHSKSNDVKPYSIDELATNKVPHNIPYLEILRTDELYYEEYKSPFLSEIDVGSGSSSESGDAESEDNGTEGTEESGGDASSSASKFSTRAGAQISNSPKHSTKTKNAKLNNALKSIVKSNFKSKTDTITKFYMQCKTNKISIGVVTTTYAVYLKNQKNAKNVTNAVYNAKHRYS